jgi:hypothetical protein
MELLYEGCMGERVIIRSFPPPQCKKLVDTPFPYPYAQTVALNVEVILTYPCIFR